MGKIIDGKAAAARVIAFVTEQGALFHRLVGQRPGLAVCIVGDDVASQTYVRAKEKRAQQAGFTSRVIRKASATRAELLDCVDSLNKDSEIHGILVQLPLPDGVEERAVIDRIAPAKDVDGFHIINSGKLMCGLSDGFVPCTPLGCLHLIKQNLETIEGQNALVLGRSNIVGKPMASLLLAHHATVTIAHSRTRNLPELCRSADILVAAVGKAGFVHGDWIKRGALVVDVGINRVVHEGKARLVGDVDFDSAAERAAAITPVPGGVGPMTIAMLLWNTLNAAYRSAGLPAPPPLAE